MSLHNLHGKRVLVTGAAAGIGRATAVAFARRGAELVLCDRRAGSLIAVRDEVRSHGARCSIFEVDVADESAMTAFSAQVHAQGGAIDVLVNNAGDTFLGSLADPRLAWRLARSANLIGAVLGLRLFLPQMHAAGGSRRVVNVAAVSGMLPLAGGESAYAASRIPLLGLSDALDMELRLLQSQVAVTMVRPVTMKRLIEDTLWGSSALADPLAHTRLQARFESRGANAQIVAEAIVRAVRRGHEKALVGPQAKPLYHLRRATGALLRRIVA